jgi:hypothetical protein
MYKAKWSRYPEDGVPGPGDFVKCGNDIFTVVTVIQRPDKMVLDKTLKEADLDIEAVYPPDYPDLYEKGDFYVAPIEGYMIRDGWFAFDGFNEEGKPCWIQPAKMGRVYSKEEAHKVMASLQTETRIVPV